MISQNKIALDFSAKLKKNSRSNMRHQSPSKEGTKIQKIHKLTEMIYQMRPGVGQHCWQVSLFKNSSLSEIPNEIVAAEKEVDSESLQNLCTK